jgi:HD-like signal output (HDOD) protein
MRRHPADARGRHQQEFYMALVPIGQLGLGMTLSEDVKDMNGRLLIAKGVSVESQHLRVLKMWGVGEVAVEEAEPEPADAPSGINTEQMDRAGREIIRAFADLDLEHPAIKEIVKLSIPCRAARPTGEPGPGEAASRGRKVEDPRARDVISRIERIDVKLPEVPSVVFELNEIISDPLSSSADIARLVNQSPSLAALLLKIVNSAFYGFRSKVDSISRAVVMIGSKEISNLALGITIMEAFKDIPRRVMDVTSFMEHSLGCGIVSRILAAYANITATEQLFVSGLLHDIGRLVVCRYFPDVMGLILADARRADTPVMQSERTVAGKPHTQIGRKLIQKWKLPYALENNVLYHHNPSASPNPEAAAVVQAADIIMHGLGFSGSGEHRVPGFDTAAWDRLKVPAGALPAVIRQAVHQIDNFRKAIA